MGRGNNPLLSKLPNGITFGELVIKAFEFDLEGQTKNDSENSIAYEFSRFCTNDEAEQLKPQT